MKIIYKGELTWDLAPDCEGILWAMETGDVSVGYKGTIYIKRGDHLKIFDEQGRMIFDGIIELDFETGYDTATCRQRALGIWVHWIQKGWSPDDWGRLFLRRKNQPFLKAELTTNRKV